MSYVYETQYNSPNFTEGYNSRKYLIIHWWDDPAKNPTYEGSIATLMNPTRQASAHYVATGTGRRVACLVSPDDTAWHAGAYPPAYNVNPDSIGIECDPRCRPEDYDVVAELIANIRSAYGDLPLKRHSDFVNTQCPGNWDLVRLDAIARTKDGSGDWGVVTDIKPPVVTITVTKVVYDDLVAWKTKGIALEAQVKILNANVTALTKSLNTANAEIARLKALPPQVVIQEKIVEKIVIKEVPIGFDQLSLGELLSEAFRKLFKIK